MCIRTYGALVLGLSVGAFGQPAPSLAFEAASVKPSAQGGRGRTLTTDPSGRFMAERATLRMLVAFAYGVRDFQLSGGPNWIDTAQYDIVAKPAAKSIRAQTLLMVQGLLADRFQLKLHRETKELPIFVLVVAKNGPKFKESKPDDNRPVKGLQGGAGELLGLGASMDSLAARLAAYSGRLVIDRTGLVGRYDFKLQWTPESGQQPRSPDERTTDTLETSILTALQEQLGLKLEAQKGPVETLVIDYAARPSAN